jgi:hypothetical protein
MFDMLLRHFRFEMIGGGVDSLLPSLPSLCILSCQPSVSLAFDRKEGATYLKLSTFALLFCLGAGDPTAAS